MNTVLGNRNIKTEERTREISSTELQLRDGTGINNATTQQTGRAMEKKPFAVGFFDDVINAETKYALSAH